MSEAFFDTNIVFYAADSDSSAQEKHLIARDLMVSRAVTVSTQVMLETYNALRRKLHYQHDEAMEWISLLRQQDVVTLSHDAVIEGLALAKRHEISHWDAQILIAAQRGGSSILYSEDLNHGQTYGSVRVCNPFKEDFLA